jgi:hypothetical protein
MANNIDITPGTGKTVKTTDTASVHVPHHNLDVAAAGFSVDIGPVSDAGVISDANGSLSAKLRGLIILMLRFPASIGQKLKATSLAVVLASDSDPIQIAAGSAQIGSVLIGDSAYAQVITPTSSADMSSIADLTAAPTSGQHTVVESVTISAAAAMVVTLKEETTLTVLKVFNLTSSNLNAEWNPARGLKLPNVDKKLRAIASVSGQVDITVISHSAA